MAAEPGRAGSQPTSEAFAGAPHRLRALQGANWPRQVPRTVEYPPATQGLVDLRHWALARPEATGIECYGRQINYAEHDELSDRFAYGARHDLARTDLARTDDLARTKEMIKTNGMGVFPAEVEALLRRHPEVSAAAVVPKPDRARGQVALTFVVSTTMAERDTTEEPA